MLSSSLSVLPKGSIEVIAALHSQLTFRLSGGPRSGPSAATGC
jgi:hypothetical protein